MMRICSFGFCIVAALVGCTKPTGQLDSPAGDEPIIMDMAPPETEDAHGHPSEGPHNGTLVELGNEEFHVEIVHDAESVTVYVLDAAAKVAVPIDAADISINLMQHGEAQANADHQRYTVSG